MAAKSPSEIWRDYETDGVPSSGNHAPIKADIRQWAAELQFGRPQRAVVETPIAVAANDQILNCNINADSACALPTAASRDGVPLTFKDLGHATAHPITITPFGTETIDGVNAAVQITNDRGEITLVPFNDGVNTGWYIS